MASKKILFIILIFLGVVVIEFVILEVGMGISLPSDRYSASSTLEIKTKGTEIHFITRNRRFSVVTPLSAHGSRREAWIIRESFFMDREDGREGPPDASITVEALKGDHVRWSFREPGERGDVLTDYVYRVIKGSNGETPNVYSYFSMVDGQKVLTKQNVELSTGELEKLERSLPQ